MDTTRHSDPEEDVERRQGGQIELVPPDPTGQPLASQGGTLTDPDGPSKRVKWVTWSKKDAINFSSFPSAFDHNFPGTDATVSSFDPVTSSVLRHSLEISLRTKDEEDAQLMQIDPPAADTVKGVTAVVDNDAFTPVCPASQSPLKNTVIPNSDIDVRISPHLYGPNRPEALKTPRQGSVVDAVKKAPSPITSVEQEAKILARINELRKMGKWEDSRIPRCVVPEPFSRGVKNFTKEVCWVATLIEKERKAKIAMAKKLAYAAKRWHEKKEEQKERQQREELQRLRKIAKQVSSAVMVWWTEVRKVAQLKQKEEIEIQKKRIRDLHLQHLMDQTEDYSSRMAQVLSKSASQTAIAENHKAEEDLDLEFRLDDDESVADEEDTISDEESQSTMEEQSRDEGAALAEEANVPLDDFLSTLPPDYREYLLSQQANTSPDDEPPSKRLRTRSRLLSASSVKQEEPMDDDLRLLVNDSHEPLPGGSQGDSSVLDEKIRSHEAALEKLRPKGNSLSSTQVVTKIPFLLRGQLREYQHVGLDWLVSLYKNKMNGILADEMGLGKTIQTIAFLAHLACEEQNWGPHLIIVPTSVLLNWELEFKRWCPGFIIKTYYGNKKQRAELRTGWTKPDSFHICITSYKIATQDSSVFRRMRWHYLILDEAQAIKNCKSQRWMKIADFPSQRRLLLTGTPMQNSLEEVWALLHFLAPELFESLTMFQQLFANPMTAMSEGRKPQDTAIVKQLHTVLRPFILRRMKTEVETQLPKKYEHVLNCRLSKRQRYLYEDYMSRTKTQETLKLGNYLSVINILMQLRKVCNHPNLFEERPVLSPLVLHPLSVELPSLVFDAICKKPIEELSQLITAPFWSVGSEFPSNLSSRMRHLMPKKPLIEEIPDVPDSGRRDSALSYPKNLSVSLDMLEFDMVDLTNGPPFVPANDRKIEKIVTIHYGKTKRSRPVRKNDAKRNGMPDDAGENTAKRRKFVQTGGRLATKQLAEFVIPQKKITQREEHLDVLDKVNRGRCRVRAIFPPDLVRLLTVIQEEEEESSGFASGYLYCRSAQKDVLAIGHRGLGLAGLVEMGSSTSAVLDDPVMRFWIDRASVAFAPVLTNTPVLSVSSLNQRSSGSVCRNQAILEPALITALEPLHPVERLRILKFPETRLIQYDCGKLQTLDVLLQQLYEEKHRALIFTQMTRVLDILEVFLTYHGYKYLRLDGSTGVEMRQILMERFNRDTRYFCFILSTRSGGIGVNLTGADTVIFYDSDWNPTMDAQAQDRCHRIGQTRDVHIYRLISQSTVEENIFNKANQKRLLGHMAIESGEFTTAVLKKENFKDIFGLKDDETFAEMDEDINELAYENAISKAEDSADVEAAKKAKAEAKAVDENEENDDDDDDDEIKFKAISKLLTPVQCYGVRFAEAHVLDQDVMDELAQHREEVERRKKEWELMRLESAKAEKAKAAEEAAAPYVVDRTLMDAKLYHSLDTGETIQEHQDPDMPMFDLREGYMADKENYLDIFDARDDIVRDFQKWGTLYRNPAPEPFIPQLSKRANNRYMKNKAKKEGKQNQDMSLSAAAKGVKRKAGNPFQFSFDLANGRGTRLPPHMSGGRENLMGADFPESLPQLEAATADFRTFEDWQIVMTSTLVQGTPPTPTAPAPSATSCELVSYVSAAFNPRFRPVRDCQFRLKAIRMREDKLANEEIVPVPKKKKRNKDDPNPALDKLPMSVPKKVALAVQDDNNKTRTQLYRDVCSSFRNFAFNVPKPIREPGTLSRNFSTASTVSGDGAVGEDGALDPLMILKRRQDRSNMSKNFINESTTRLAASLGLTVDAHGQPTQQNALCSPTRPAPSILQQTLQATTPTTPGPLLSSVMGVPPRTPLPSPQVFALGGPARRPVFNAGSASPAPGSPLPSIGSTAINQLISSVPSLVNSSTVNPAATTTVAPTATSPAIRPAVSVSSNANKIAQLRELFRRLESQSGTAIDANRVKDFLTSRGIVFSAEQINDLVKAYGSGSLSRGADGQAAATPTTVAATATTPTAVPVAAAATVPKAIAINVPSSPAMVRLPAAAGIRQGATGPTISLSLHPAPPGTATQVTQIVGRSPGPAVRRNASAPAVTVLKNGPVISGAPPNVTITSKPIQSAAGTVPVQIIPASGGGGTTDLRLATPAGGAIHVNSEQLNRIMSLYPGRHSIQRAGNTMSVQRVVAPATPGSAPQAQHITFVPNQSGQSNVLVIQQANNSSQPSLILQPPLHLQSAQPTVAAAAERGTASPVVQQQLPPPSQPPPQPGVATPPVIQTLPAP
ncbi:helicase domino-like isoform X2 [Paramacrobiotus metropolitanus]|uniref:helicase domino-like isoform X2 n=1 Tax=Paramacrobiotus metropolitanus TaxID=2943436 RepID=UPI0024457EF7|nr:helicase domino-like isoform X2 [Paramacrobiotus metropolitanus]